jgi:hypothetical protein
MESSEAEREKEVLSLAPADHQSESNIPALEDMTNLASIFQ